MRCVPAHYFTVAKAIAWRSAIDDRPPYQRESAIWSLDKQQLFIDSLLNGYDVPKIYLHDLRGKRPTRVYAIVDGKQRLTTIWDFLADEFPLAPDFKVERRNMPELPADAVAPRAGQRFSEFDRHWKEVLRQTFLSVVLIRHATEEDIEDLFSRLNNGEPLNAAEKRNAMGGALARLIRTVARRPFFTERLHFTNARHHHYELATRLLLVEQTRPTDGGGLPDLRSAALDTFVRSNRRLSAADRADLAARLDTGLVVMSDVFRPADPLLSSPSHAFLYYLFVRSVVGDETATSRPDRVRAFLDGFQRSRVAALDLPESERDGTLIEFSGLMQHGTNDARNVARRLEILAAAWARESAAG
jgi:hypothetical protein